MRSLNKILIFLALLFMANMPRPAGAEVVHITLGVDGLACSFCAYGLEKKLKQLAPIEALEISLKNGTVTLDIAEGKSPDFNRILQAVREAGFTLRGIELTAIGSFVVRNDSLFLKLRFSEDKYIVLGKKSGNSVTLASAGRKLQNLVEQNAVVSVTGEFKRHSGGAHSLSLDTVERVWSLVLNVEGLSCEVCIQKLDKVLRESLDIYRISGSHVSKQVTIEVIGKPPESAILVNIINKAGFKTTILEEWK